MNTGRPSQIVAIQANTGTVLGSEITIVEALKIDRPIVGRPVAITWCTQTPKPSIIVATVDSATAV